MFNSKLHYAHITLMMVQFLTRFMNEALTVLVQQTAEVGLQSKFAWTSSRQTDLQWQYRLSSSKYLQYIHISA